MLATPLNTAPCVRTARASRGTKSETLSANKTTHATVRTLAALTDEFPAERKAADVGGGIGREDNEDR